MYTRDYRDIIGGLLLMLFGAGVFFQAYYEYPLGTLRHMGPGMFPATLGAILGGLGFFILLPALFRAGPPLPRIELRPLLAIIGGGLAFAFIVTRFGMVPGVIVLTVFSVMADDKLGVVGTIILSAVLSLLIVAIFSYGLGVSLQPFRWPF
ncbi:MAG: tripartite tricarboxylate transporter TctB family protein [Beijerinckiaceae bacterium]|nr:tripartite tricarboxylate transporter TctB family protein [Beijerinckiaceae bacterium]